MSKVTDRRIGNIVVFSPPPAPSAFEVAALRRRISELERQERTNRSWYHEELAVARQRADQAAEQLCALRRQRAAEKQSRRALLDTFIAVVDQIAGLV